MRRIRPKRFNLGPTAEPQAVVDFRKESIEAAVALVRDRMTFLQLADVLGVKHEFVRSRLTQTPTKLLWTGKAYQVPYQVGVEFVRSVLSARRIVKEKLGLPIANILDTAEGLEVGVSADRYKFYRFTLPELVAKNAELRQAVGQQIAQAYLSGYKTGGQSPG